MAASPGRVVVAHFGAAHGVRGEIRLKSHTENPLDVAKYGPLAAPDGREFVIERARPAANASADMLVVAVEGVTDRDAASALNGLELSISRERLPALDGEDYYHADLIGLSAVTTDGAALGTVAAIYNHGAGDILEIATNAEPILVPFTKAVVPTVDITGGRIVIDPPAGLLGGEDDGDET